MMLLQHRQPRQALSSRHQIGSTCRHRLVSGTTYQRTIRFTAEADMAALIEVEQATNEVDSTGNKAALTESEVAASPEDAAALIGIVAVASTGDVVVVSIAVDAASVAVVASNRDLTPRAVRCLVRYPSHSLLAPTVCH